MLTNVLLLKLGCQSCLTPDDEAFVQLAFESKADHLVSFNIAHLAPARALGISLLAPKEFLKILRA